MKTAEQHNAGMVGAFEFTAATPIPPEAPRRPATCDTCKHWQPPHVWDAIWEINRPAQTVAYGTCDNPKLADDDSVIDVGQAPDVPLDHACPYASDEHELCFRTGPKFGCIHHEHEPR